MTTENNIIELRHVKKCYEKDTPVIKDFSLTIKKGEFVTFLGPSGCGKTTILRMIGGFEQPTGGEILLHGKDISKLPPAKRPINTVFQKYALFTHMNIEENIAFGLKIKNKSKSYIYSSYLFSIIIYRIFFSIRILAKLWSTFQSELGWRMNDNPVHPSEKALPDTVCKSIETVHHFP